MSTDRRMMIPSPDYLPNDESLWRQNYEKSGYQEVYSITDEPEVCETLVRQVPPTARNILIPGCGSKTFLQQAVIEHLPDVEEVVCTDLTRRALDMASQSFKHERVRYERADTTQLPFASASFDAVLICNSILSSDDLTNRRMVAECARVLRPDGILSGLFPTIFCALEITLLAPEFREVWKDSILLERSTFYEEEQGMHQIFYTPLRLNQIFREAGLTRVRLEICFFDTPKMQEENERYYKLPKDSGLAPWEYLAVCSRNQAAAEI